MNDNEASKPWWSSITLWSAVMQIATGFGLTGLQIDFTTGDFHGNIYELSGSVMPILTGMSTAYGRLRRGAGRRIRFRQKRP